MSRIFVVLAMVGFWLGGAATAYAQGEKEPARPAMATFPPLKIAANDSPAAKLKKEKFNAALSAFRRIDALVVAGKPGRTYGDPGTLEVTRSLKDSILDLDDPALRMKAFDAYVDLTKFSEKDSLIKLEAGAIDPYKSDLTRYRRLDAELLQLQMKKQAEKK